MIETVKEKIPAFNFIRAICAVGIVINHYSIESENAALQRFMYTFPNGAGSVGYTLVTVFLIISGALLYYNHETVSSVRIFYASRCRAIFPSYYIAYLLASIGTLIFKRSFYADKSIATFPLTLIGMDGYFAGSIRTYRLVGEWFVGAIIIAYLFYPLILKALKKYEIFMVASGIVLFFVLLDWRMLEQHPFRNVVSILTSFAFGVLITRYKLYKSPEMTLWGGVSLILVCFFSNDMDTNLSAHIAGAALFFTLFGAGNVIMSYPFQERIFNAISDVSYEMFLIQRIAIVYSLRIFKPQSNAMSFLCLILIVAETFVGALIIAFLRKKALALFDGKNRVKTGA